MAHALCILNNQGYRRHNCGNAIVLQCCILCTLPVLLYFMFCDILYFRVLCCNYLTINVSLLFNMEFSFQLAQAVFLYAQVTTLLVTIPSFSTLTTRSSDSVLRKKVSATSWVGGHLSAWMLLLIGTERNKQWKDTPQFWLQVV